MILNYKELYTVVKLAVIEDPGYTEIANFLFSPVLVSLNEFNVTNSNSRAWARGEENIPVIAQKYIGKRDCLDKLISFYNSNMIDNVLVEALREDMFDALAALVQSCDIKQNKKTKWLKLHEQGKNGAFLANVFQFAVLQKNKVSSSKKQKKASDPKSEAADEFRSLVGNKLKKPKAIVPETVQPEELGYVKELYAAYKDATGVSVENPDDLDRLNYRQHFEQQRKTYYAAEIIHQAVRDSTLPNEDYLFDNLKDEIEDGIYEVSHEHYEDGVKKIDAVMKQAALLPISPNVDHFTYNWIAAGEKKGVCHMLVSEERLKWVDDDEEK